MINLLSGYVKVIYQLPYNKIFLRLSQPDKWLKDESPDRQPINTGINYILTII